MGDEHGQQPDPTRRLPDGEEPGPLWSGRAEVRPSYGAPEENAGEWIEDGAAEDRRWWTPIALGVVALLLLALLGVGLWLALRSAEPAPPTGPPSPSVTGPPSTPATPSVEPSTAAPSTPATTTAPARVTVPPLAGLPEEVARALLDRLGLTYRLRFEPSDRPAGTIVRTDPPSGTRVASGDEITLVVAEEPGAPPTSAPASTAPPTGPPTTG